LIRDGVLKVNINQRMPLSDIAAAHAAMAAGDTTGSTVLVP
jgi:NADPH2:quinone reductase